MAKFRQKPVVVEAEQWWPGKSVDGVHDEQDDHLVGRIAFFDTHAGPNVVRPGDWIITGVAGERYPCRADLFELTYETVEE